VTKEGLHLHRSLGQWTRDSNLEWRYTQSPTNVLFDTTLRLQAIPVRPCPSSITLSVTFSVWRPAPRITTFSTLATVSSQYPLTAASRGTTVQVTPPTPTPISFEAHLLLQPSGPRRLLQKFEQHVSDTCMIEHLRSIIKSKTISTDGGLSLIGQGTFGWMPGESNLSQVQALSTVLLPKRVPPTVSSMALPRHWNTFTNFHAITRCNLKASTSGNAIVNVRSLQPTFCLNSNNGGDSHHTMLISFQI
jgi:hypothetical protein